MLYSIWTDKDENITSECIFETSVAMGVFGSISNTSPTKNMEWQYSQDISEFSVSHAFTLD